MTYRFLVPEPVARKIAAYDKSVRKMLEKYIQKHLVDAEDPRVFGKALKYQHIGLWRYRVGDYRLLVEINDHQLVIIAVDFAQRSEIYK